MHNIFYPQTWREASLDIAKLWFMNECRSEEDLDLADRMFEDMDYFKDEKAMATISSHIVNLCENHQPNSYEEV